MVNIQMYVVGNSRAADDVENLDLFEFSKDDDSCENCAEPVGFCGARFIPLVLCQDSGDSWLACMECAGPVVNPGA